MRQASVRLLPATFTARLERQKNVRIGHKQAVEGVVVIVTLNVWMFFRDFQSNCW
jgi:hypothetical protein